MRNRFFGLLTLLAALGCGAPAADETAGGDADSTAVGTTSLRQLRADGSLDTAATIDAIRREYSRIEALAANDKLRQDSLEYECAEMYGTLRFFYEGDELLLASRDYVVGDHFGGEEAYYFHQGEPFFAFLTESSWQFDTESTAAADSESTPTRDDIYELRRYYADGRVIKELYKDYTIRSAGNNTPAEQIPNQNSGRGVSEDLGADVLLQTAQRQSFNCGLLLQE